MSSLALAAASFAFPAASSAPLAASLGSGVVTASFTSGTSVLTLSVASLAASLAASWAYTAHTSPTSRSTRVSFILNKFFFVWDLSCSEKVTWTSLHK
ncbi:hypothetical protein CpipJ_CPIJ009879 [Culex quinquefasciatus]|uniref:Secreted protein n=1 Tax=Culex quinquefasciatus TaxID=7176 RepID=B0WT83_CULQU|nr:hypothetical protein CpipJ_CPIJ009879 [Culex quinquefasciatus]|eukprot:XP_001870840.1 hypothetical protein CpipJ_CPIJ009879 [Culex quinquefasciatus]